MDALLVAFVLTAFGAAASMVVAIAGDAFNRPVLVRRARATALVMVALLMFSLACAGLVSDDEPPSDDTGIALVFLAIGFTSFVCSVAVGRGRLWTTGPNSPGARG